MPITLEYFTAKVEDGKTLLQWETAQELNNKQFIIERANKSTPDIFTQVGLVKATSSPTGSTYSLQNQPAISGTYLYRLSQQDIDGDKKVLGIRSITFKSKVNWFVQDLGIEWKLSSDLTFTYRLIDANGRLIKAGIGIGNTTIKKPSAKGVYQIQVSINGISSTQKILN